MKRDILHGNMQGTPTHIEFLHKNENDPKRDKRRCTYYQIEKKGRCAYRYEKCPGSANCPYYQRLSDKEMDRRAIKRQQGHSVNECSSRMRKAEKERIIQTAIRRYESKTAVSKRLDNQQTNWRAISKRYKLLKIKEIRLNYFKHKIFSQEQIEIARQKFEDVGAENVEVTVKIMNGKYYLHRGYDILTIAVFKRMSHIWAVCVNEEKDSAKTTKQGKSIKNCEAAVMIPSYIAVRKSIYHDDYGEGKILKISLEENIIYIKFKSSVRKLDLIDNIKRGFIKRHR